MKLGGYRIDRREKVEGLTLAGLLMFGKIDSIKDNYCCPHYFPDYREYMSANPEDRWTDRICPDGTWEANLFQFYLKVYSKLSAILPKPFALKNGIRIEDTPTHIALREAFVNTLIHCDYTIDANITIELHKDYFVFSNPGSLLISIAQYYQGGESVCRNKSLQQMFMYLGTAEKAGSGVDKILQGWKEANSRSPQIEEKTKPDKVSLTLPLVGLLSDDVISHLKTLFGESITSIEHDSLLTLATCCSEKEITNYRLQLVIDKHSADIIKLLKELCDKQYLISSGVGRGTHYKLNKSYLTDNKQINSNNVASNVASNVARSSHKKTKRLSTQELQNKILQACPDFETLENIAQKVNKGIHYLKNHVIPKMTEQQLLERKYPNSPKHPRQQYRAAPHKK